jgi:hypothetical protein
MCALEGSKQQNTYRCNSLKTFAAQCWAEASRRGIPLSIIKKFPDFNWRKNTRCGNLKNLIKKVMI